MRRPPLLVCLVCFLWIAANFALAGGKEKAPGKTGPSAKPTAAAKAKPAAKEDDDDEDDDSADVEQQPAAKQAASAKAAVKGAVQSTRDKKPAEKTATVVLLTLKGDYPEGPGQDGPLGELRPTLGAVVERMDQAAEDKAVAAVWLRINGLELGAGKINELRAAVTRIRKAGKPVYAELTTADPGEYLLAAACDEIIMPSSGMLLLPGVHAEVTFYKGLLDKLGLQFDALQMGKYKGFAEPYTRSGMSPALRESMEAIIDDSYEAMVAAISAGRRLKDYEVKTLLDRALFSASAACKAGLIDRVCYADEFQDSLAKKLKADRVETTRNYKKKRMEEDFSGIGGLVKLMQLFAGAKPAENAASAKRLAIVYAVGPIVEGKSQSSMFGENVLGSTTLCEAIRKAADDPKVVAVVLRIDSPGGSATASDLIWREVVRCRKPLIASMGDVAGSGGYYIAMAARKIFAAPGAITGSIGVIGGKLVTGGLYEKLGLTTEVISRGKNSGSLSSRRAFTPEEREAWTAVLSETYQQFVGKAAQGRKMEPAKLEQLAQGRIYTGRMAKRLGLIDELGALHDAVVAAKQAAGMKADAEVELLLLPQPKTFFEQLFGGDASVSSDLDSALPEFFPLIRQAATWRRLLGEKTLLWMPYRVQVR